MTNPYAQTGETATRFAERMLAELETDMGVHHDEPFVRMSRLRLHELRNAIQGLLARPEAGVAFERLPMAFIQHHKGGDNLVWEDPGGDRTPLYRQSPPQSGSPSEDSFKWPIKEKP